MKTISTSNKRKVKAQRLRFDQFETEPNEPGNKHSRKRGRALRLRGFAVLNYGAGCQCCCDINDMLKYISARASARGALLKAPPQRTYVHSIATHNWNNQLPLLLIRSSTPINQWTGSYEASFWKHHSYKFRQKRKLKKKRKNMPQVLAGSPYRVLGATSLSGAVPAVNYGVNKT